MGLRDSEWCHSVNKDALDPLVLEWGQKMTNTLGSATTLDNTASVGLGRDIDHPEQPRPLSRRERV